MNLLLDTHILIWWLDESSRLRASVRTALERPENRIWVSAISIWEISIKVSVGRLRMTEPAEERIAWLLERGRQSLAVTFDHAFAVRRLPLHHGDPFDRMLIAQAQCENLTLVTADPAILAYDVRAIDATR